MQAIPKSVFSANGREHSVAKNGAAVLGPTQPLLLVPKAPGVEVVRPARLLRLSQIPRRSAASRLTPSRYSSPQDLMSQAQQFWPHGWLWPRRIALGKVTVLVGESGLGKSSIVADWAARVSQGSPWPGQNTAASLERSTADAPQGTALVVCPAEEQVGLLPARLEAAGADFDQVCTIAMEPLDDDPVANSAVRPRSIVERLALVQSALQSLPDCKLVVIDSLSIFLEGPDGRSSGATQRVILGLAKLARQFGVAIVAVAHLPGTASLRAFSQFSATLGPPSIGRSVWAVLRDPEDVERQLMVSLDGNFAKPGATLGFRLAAGADSMDADFMCGIHVEWADAKPTSLWQVLRASSGCRIAERKYRDTENYVQERLREVLAEGPVERHIIGREIRASDEQLFRAAKHLGVVKQKSGFLSGWTWMLPEHFAELHGEREQIRAEQTEARESRKNERRKEQRAEERQAREVAGQEMEVCEQLEAAALSEASCAPAAKQPIEDIAPAEFAASSCAEVELPSEIADPIPLGKRDLPGTTHRQVAPPLADLPPIDFGLSKLMSDEEAAWCRNLAEKQKERDAAQARAQQQAAGVGLPDEDDESMCWVDDWKDEDFKECGWAARAGPG